MGVRRAARTILDACDEADGVEDDDSMYRQVTVTVSVVVEGANGVSRRSFIYILKVRTHRQKALQRTARRFGAMKGRMLSREWEGGCDRHSIGLWS
jgi:hypothetical protein